MSPTSKSLDKIGNHGRKSRQVAAYGVQSQPVIVGGVTINSSAQEKEIIKELKIMSQLGKENYNAQENGPKNSHVPIPN